MYELRDGMSGQRDRGVPNESGIDKERRNENVRIHIDEG